VGGVEDAKRGNAQVDDNIGRYGTSRHTSGKGKEELR